MKIVNNLTNTTIKKYPCFSASPENDFYDDGNSFKGYVYTSPNGNGTIIITTLRSQNETYLSIREDYMRNNYTFNEWIKLPEARLAEKFNGVPNFDIDELVENCEAVLIAVNQLNTELEKDVVDTKPIKEAIVDEALEMDELLNKIKQIDWLQLDLSTLDSIHRQAATIRARRNYAKAFYDSVDTMTRRERIECLDRLNSCGYVLFDKNGYTANKCKEYIEQFAA